MSLFKNFTVTEGFRAQLRWETFNTFNHTQFGSANLTMTNTSFGRITSTRVGPRRMQLGLRLTFLDTGEWHSHARMPLPLLFLYLENRLHLDRGSRR